jgi:hypothetical protein
MLPRGRYGGERQGYRTSYVIGVRYISLHCLALHCLRLTFQTIFVAVEALQYCQEMHVMSAHNGHEQRTVRHLELILESESESRLLLQANSHRHRS